MTNNIGNLYVGLFVAFTLFACGSQKGVKEPDAPRGVIQAAFEDAANDSGVPLRMMMATAFLESGLRNQPQTVTYIAAPDKANESFLPLGESIFGMSLRELGLANDPSSDSSLSVQIAAYGRLLKDRLKGKGLPPNAVTPEEKHRWIWGLAQVHRGADRQNRNLWSIFAKEMMGILNNGFDVKDQNSDEYIKLEKESTPLKEEQLPSNFQQDLSLDTYYADIGPAHLFSLRSSKFAELRNVPQRIEVVHCPLSLSACLNIQNNSDSNHAALGAHYIIPNNSSTSPGILQMARHDEPVELIDASGSTETVLDRIVIMLAGNSGKYVHGVRKFADPMWLTDYQLRLLGVTIRAICEKLERGPQKVSRAVCSSAEGEGTLKFRTQPVGMYRWGDISEFDESVFYPYLSSEEGVLANTTMVLSEGTGIVEAGAQFSMNLQFQAAAKRIEVERLVRCDGADQRVIWEPIDVKPVRNVTSKSVEMFWYDAGPNGNGDQFFRAKVSGDGGKFLGWATSHVKLKNYSKENLGEGISRYCFR